MTMQDAVSTMPVCLMGGFDPHYHNTIELLRELGQHELDMFDDGEETDIQSDAEYRQVDRWMERL